MLAGLAHLVFGPEAAASPSLPLLLKGPFVNPNHTAEFLALCGFAGLSLTLSAREERRAVWGVAAVVFWTLVVSTESRGGVVSVMVGLLTFVVVFATTSMSSERRHEPLGAAGILLKMAVVGTVVFGLAVFYFGGPDVILGVLDVSAFDDTSKALIWKDALAVLRAHPAGVGRGAFVFAYPIHRTLAGGRTFDYAENEALQLFLDFGVPGGLVILGAAVVFVLTAYRLRRRDPMEAGLVGGVVALALHNLADFGLEMPGILLPAAAFVGVAFGRASGSRRRRSHRSEMARAVPGLPSLGKPPTAFDGRPAGRSVPGRRGPWLAVVTATSLCTGLFCGAPVNDKCRSGLCRCRDGRGAESGGSGGQRLAAF